MSRRSADLQTHSANMPIVKLGVVSYVRCPALLRTQKKPTTVSTSAPAQPRRPFRRSPNQRRVVGRTVFWALTLGGVAVWLPHLMH